MFKEISIADKDVQIQGHLNFSGPPRAWIIFAHGSGSSRHSKRNNWVAQELNKLGFATLLFDLLTPEEDEIYRSRFNIELLSHRLLLATEWLMKSPDYHGEPIGYFGASTGAAAALMAAGTAPSNYPIYAIISRGGRPDLAPTKYLNRVSAPTLLIVGSHDGPVIEYNKLAQEKLLNVKLVLVEGASHLFEEPGTLREVVNLSSDWLVKNLP